jgi:hypothetical protein
MGAVVDLRAPVVKGPDQGLCGHGGGGAAGECHIGTSTLAPVKNEPALTCLNSARRAR